MLIVQEVEALLNEAADKLDPMKGHTKLQANAEEDDLAKQLTQLKL